MHNPLYVLHILYLLRCALVPTYLGLIIWQLKEKSSRYGLQKFHIAASCQQHCCTVPTYYCITIPLTDCIQCARRCILLWHSKFLCPGLIFVLRRFFAFHIQHIFIIVNGVSHDIIGQSFLWGNSQHLRTTGPRVKTTIPLNLYWSEMTFRS